LSISKVLVIGLDGATFNLIDPWVKQGKLPTLSQCIKQGIRSELISTPLSNSAQAWSTFATGKNAGKHGIFDFFERTPGRYDIRFVNASFRKGKNLWEIINEFGKKVTVMNVPMTYPAKEINGIILSGLDAPGITDGFAYPPGIMDEITKKVNSYVLEPGIWGYIRQGKHSMALEKLRETIKIRTQTAKYLMTNYPWEFFMIVFTESDKVQHHFWKYMKRPGPYQDAILKIYQHLDNSIREILNSVDNQTQVYIISDHGGGPSTNRTFFINKWLSSEGFLRFNNTNMRRRIIHRIINSADGVIKRNFPRNVKEFLVRTFPNLRGRVESVVSLSGVDWVSTKAYSRENTPAIFINLKGREPNGIIDPEDEYFTIRETIVRKLKSLLCPETGEKIVDHVFLREEVYWGEEINKAPDIIFKWKDHRYIHRPSNPYSQSGFIKILGNKEINISELFYRPSGIHRDEGILIAFGPGVRTEQRLSKAKLMDMAPTLIHALGLPVPDDMDGEVLIPIFEEKFLKNMPVTYSKKDDRPHFEGTKKIYDTDEEHVIEDRLKGLGYID